MGRHEGEKRTRSKSRDHHHRSKRHKSSKDGHYAPGSFEEAVSVNDRIRHEKKKKQRKSSSRTHKHAESVCIPPAPTFGISQRVEKSPPPTLARAVQQGVTRVTCSSSSSADAVASFGRRSPREESATRQWKNLLTPATVVNIIVRKMGKKTPVFKWNILMDCFLKMMSADFAVGKWQTIFNVVNTTHCANKRNGVPSIFNLMDNYVDAVGERKMVSALGDKEVTSKDGKIKKLGPNYVVRYKYAIPMAKKANTLLKPVFCALLIKLYDALMPRSPMEKLKYSERAELLGKDILNGYKEFKKDKEYYDERMWTQRIHLPANFLNRFKYAGNLQNPRLGLNGARQVTDESEDDLDDDDADVGDKSPSPPDLVDVGSMDQPEDSIHAKEMVGSQDMVNRTLSKIAHVKDAIEEENKRHEAVSSELQESLQELEARLVEEKKKLKSDGTACKIVNVASVIKNETKRVKVIHAAVDVFGKVSEDKIPLYVPKIKRYLQKVIEREAEEQDDDDDDEEDILEETQREQDEQSDDEMTVEMNSKSPPQSEVDRTVTVDAADYQNEEVQDISGLEDISVNELMEEVDDGETQGDVQKELFLSESDTDDQQDKEDKTEEEEDATDSTSIVDERELNKIWEGQRMETVSLGSCPENGGGDSKEVQVRKRN